MTRTGAMTLFGVAGLTAFVRGALEWGVVTSAIVTVAVFAATVLLARFLNRRPHSAVTRALRRESRLEPAMTALWMYTVALLGPAFAVFGVVLVVAGLWLGAVTAVIGAWLTWEGWSEVLRRWRR